MVYYGQMTSPVVMAKYSSFDGFVKLRAAEKDYKNALKLCMFVDIIYINLLFRALEEEPCNP